MGKAVHETILIMKTLLFIFLSLYSSLSLANDLKFEDIDTCYHWLSEKNLNFKLEYAADHQGELFFHNGTLFCWRSPLGAKTYYNDVYGDRLIRIKFKPNARLIQGIRSFTLDDLASDIVYSNEFKIFHEYIIKPSAVESWSVYHPRIAKEMLAELEFYKSGEVTDNDLHFGLLGLNTQWIEGVVEKIRSLYETGQNSKIFGDNQAEHFVSRFKLPWQKFLKDPGQPEASKPSLVKIFNASYGQSNVTQYVSKWCDGKKVCQYKVSAKFLGLPKSHRGRSFDVKWKCGEDETVKSHHIPASAERIEYAISC
jgi:hypothetical protein